MEANPLVVCMFAVSCTAVTNLLRNAIGKPDLALIICNQMGACKLKLKVPE